MDIMLAERQHHERKASFSHYGLEMFRTQGSTPFQGTDQTWMFGARSTSCKEWPSQPRIPSRVLNKCVHGLAPSGGPVVKNPPASAMDAGSIPGPGRPHVLWSNRARMLFHKRCHHSEKPAHPK